LPPSDPPMLLFLPLSLHRLPPDSENNSLPSDSVSFTTASFPPLSFPGTRLSCQRPRQTDSTMEITQVQEASSRSNHPQSGLDKGAMSSCQLVKNMIYCTPVASFPGHSHLQFLIACSLMYWSSSSFSRAAIVLSYNRNYSIASCQELSTQEPSHVFRIHYITLHIMCVILL